MTDSALPVITPDWPAPGGVRAAFTVRPGGVSAPPFDTLNVGSHTGDTPEAVQENRRRIRAALRLPSEPVWLDQVHGAEVVSLDGEWEPGGPGLRPRATPLALGTRAPGPRADALRTEAPWADAPRADALRTEAPWAEAPRADAAITRVPGRVCVIQVADCMPVLFAAQDGTAVGVAHAGWRGLAAGVLGATVRALAAPPSELLAWLGPAIGPQHFEVGDEVRAAMLATDRGPEVAGAAGLHGGPGAADAAFVRNARGRWQCDLYAIARQQLQGLGLREVYGGGWCTYADPARFFSYRREGRCGRMAALVWIEVAS